jgi:hypothetical protein
VAVLFGRFEIQSYRALPFEERELDMVRKEEELMRAGRHDGGMAAWGGWIVG